MHTKTIARPQRTVGQVEDRIAVLHVAQVRKPSEVATVGHEQFIRNALKDRMGWPRRESAPEQVVRTAKAMAEMLKARDKVIADKKAKARDEQAAKDAAARQAMIDAGYAVEEADAMLAA